MISANFQLNRDDFHLDVAFTMPETGVSALFGRSGSGKTTVLRCMAGLEPSARGTLTIGDKTWPNGQQTSAVHTRKVGYVFQDANLFEHLDVSKNLAYGWKRTPAHQRRINLDEAVEWLGLNDLLDRYPNELSGGQQQRVAIARALVTSPDLLLMDEPLSNLDIESKEEILPYLQSLHSRLQIPVVYVSHSPAEVIRLADHMVLLEQGQVLAQGPTNELLTRTDLPLAHLDESAALIHGRLIKHEKPYHLSYVEVQGQTLSISLQHKTIGERVRMRIAARDVSISNEAPRQSSISNVVACKIVSLDETKDQAKLIVKLSLGEQFLLAHITRKSAHTLSLTIGQEVYAQVKAVALMS